MPSRGIKGKVFFPARQETSGQVSAGSAPSECCAKTCAERGSPHTVTFKNMISVNQDILVIAGDASIAAGAKAIGALTGAGYLVSLVTTGVSVVYDGNRVFGSMSNYGTTGISVSSDSFGQPVTIIWP